MIISQFFNSQPSKRGFLFLNNYSYVKQISDESQQSNNGKKGKTDIFKNSLKVVKYNSF